MPDIMSRRLDKELIDVSGEMFGAPSSDTRKNMRNFWSFVDVSAELVIKKQLLPVNSSMTINRNIFEFLFITNFVLG